MRVKKAYLKSERVQTAAAKLKSERAQSPTVTVSRTASTVTVKVGRIRRNAAAGEKAPTGFVVKLG